MTDTFGQVLGPSADGGVRFSCTIGGKERIAIASGIAIEDHARSPGLSAEEKAEYVQQHPETFLAAAMRKLGVGSPTADMVFIATHDLN